MYRPLPAYRFALLLGVLSFLLPGHIFSQSADEPKGSRILAFQPVGVADTAKTILEVRLHDHTSHEAVMGATVLIRRDNDKMFGKVSAADGSVRFVVKPAEYSIRVQMTGLQSLEEAGINLEKGKAYRMEIAMVKN
ncbi:MAG: carboxypeptidase regulatory-like domain-containing protein [Saprospiraceae bacterium]|nr:carboxypeptidase regulatory-like domain-containing protein [Saprospiraceae bacterium]